MRYSVIYEVATDLGIDLFITYYIRGLSEKFVDTRCFRLIFNIYKT